MTVQIGTGLFLTALYMPDLYSTGGTLSSEVAFGQASSNFLFIIFLTATVAYFLSQKEFKQSSK